MPRSSRSDWASCVERTLGRPRPFAELGFAPLIAHAADSSFPSGHTLTGVALAVKLAETCPMLAEGGGVEVGELTLLNSGRQALV